MLLEHRLATAAALLIWALTSISACATSGLTGHTFRKGDIAFRVGQMPDDWRLLEDPSVEGDLASFAFRSDQRRVTVGVAGRCGRDGDDVPLRSLTQHLTIGFTDRHIVEQREFTLDGRAALRTVMTASLDGVPKHLAFVVLKKDGCVYDFWRIADSSNQSTHDFDGFVGGFTTID
jgi:hypothetical protein